MSIQKLKKRAGMTFTGYQENHDQARNQIKRLLWTNHKTKSKLLLCNPGVLNPNYTLKKKPTNLLDTYAKLPKHCSTKMRPTYLYVIKSSKD